MTELSITAPSRFIATEVPVALNTAVYIIKVRYLSFVPQVSVGCSYFWFGFKSLFTNTTGIQNTGLGESALRANTTANNNTAVGFSALTANTTGTNNTAVGTNSLLANTTGDENVAMGVNALDANTTGANNTGIGTSALGANTTASNNTAVGQKCFSSKHYRYSKRSSWCCSFSTNTTASEHSSRLELSLSPSNTTGASNMANR